MAAQPLPPSSRPRVPAHAWAWVQRSRAVLAEISQRLYGTAPMVGLLERLQEDYARDVFVQDLVARTVCDVAFNGRVPERRPAGARWDRGLTWWAALLAGTTVKEFERRSEGPPATQSPLFGAAPARAADPTTPGPVAPPPRPAVVDRNVVVAALRQALAAGDADTVPAALIRQLLRDLEA